MNREKLQDYFRSQRGFTLLELIIVSIIVILITTAFLPFFKVNVKAYTRVRGGKDIVQGARVCMSKMSTQISRLEGVTDIITASSGEFRFYDPNSVQYRYRRGGDDGQELLNGSLMILDNVSNLTFTYYDRTGSITTTRSDIWRIKISMTVKVDEIDNMTFSTQVFPRNFGY